MSFRSDDLFRSNFWDPKLNIQEVMVGLGIGLSLPLVSWYQTIDKSLSLLLKMLIAEVVRRHYRFNLWGLSPIIITFVHTDIVDVPFYAKMFFSKQSNVISWRHSEPRMPSGIGWFHYNIKLSLLTDWFILKWTNDAASHPHWHCICTMKTASLITF